MAKGKDIYIFNPENDLALAYGLEGYTAPPRARMLHRDLQLLPIWYCNDNAAILINNHIDAHWLEQTNATFGLSASTIFPNKLQCESHKYKPWGWNLNLRRRLINECVPENDLPPASYIQKLRELSHRRTTIAIHHSLAKKTGIRLSPEPIEVGSVEEIKIFEHTHSQCFIKAPWSGSGRGIYRVLDADARCFETWAQGIINRQGSIMCEQALDKILDFAMEFECDNGKAAFKGYSIFFNDSHCSFDRCIAAPDEYLKKRIISHLGNSVLIDIVRDALTETLTELIAPHYEGLLGVDMMLYNDNGNIKINPCVELNLRMTMGIVASAIGNKILSPSSVGSFRIAYHKSPVECNKMVTELMATNPTLIENGKLISGFLSLAPVNNNSNYCAYILAQRQNA